MKTIAELLVRDRGYLSHSKQVSLSGLNFSSAMNTDVTLLLEKLKSNGVITSINLADCPFDQYEAALLDRLFDCVSSLKTIESIGLDNTALGLMGSERLIALSSKIQMENLKEISLSLNYLFSKSSIAIHFLEILLKHNPGLERIVLRSNELGCLCQEDLMRFGTLLKQSRLKIIDLSINQLGHLSTDLLSRLISDLSNTISMKELSLGANDFSNKPLGILLPLLAQAQIEALDLSACQLGCMIASAEDWKEIFDTMVRHNCICRLKVNSNQLDHLMMYTHDAEGLPVFELKSLIFVLEQWTALKKIDISNNDLSAYSELLFYVARILLSRDPGLGEHLKFSISPIAKDFANTGYHFDLESLIQENTAAKRLSRTVQADAQVFLMSTGSKGELTARVNVADQTPADSFEESTTEHIRAVGLK